MHHISMRPLHRLHRGVAVVKEVGPKGFHVRPDASPCAAASVASWQLREQSPYVWVQLCPRRQAMQAAEQKQRQEAAGQHDRAREGATRGDRRRRSGPQSRSSGATDRAEVGGHRRCGSRVKQVPRLLLLSLSKRRNGRDGRGCRNKKTRGRRAGVYWAGMQTHEGASGRTDGRPVRSISVFRSAWSPVAPLVL
jgi:hypothetical protein